MGVRPALESLYPSSYLSKLNPNPTLLKPYKQISGLLADKGKLTDILKYHVVKLFVKDKEHIRSFRLSNKVRQTGPLASRFSFLHRRVPSQQPIHPIQLLNP